MRISLIIILLLLSGTIIAQQESQITQYVYNKLSFNPGVAGENDYGSITGLFRDQWTGIEGSPQIQMLTVNLPTIANRLGFGIHLQRQSVGIQSKTDLSGMYAYKIKFGNGHASVGLQLSYRNFVNDFTDDRLVAINGFENDFSLSQERFSTNLFNVGVGAYYKGPKYYLGISVPRYIRADISSDVTSSVAREVHHYYATAGVDINLSNDWTFSPSALFKTAAGTPFDLDILGMMTFRDQVNLGINLRTGGSQQSLLESVDLLLGLHINKNIFAAIAYDFTTTELNEFENGTFELVVKYSLKSNAGPKEIQNPRYFR